MARTLRYLFLLLFVGLAGTAFAQSGEIRGTVLDEKKEPALGAIVQVLQGGIVKGGAATDIDGFFSVKPLSPGRYEVKVSYASYKTSVTTGVIVSTDKTTGLDLTLELNQTELEGVTVTAYKVPLIDKFSNGNTTTITSEAIEKMPTRTTDGVASTSAGVYSKAGGGLSIGGGREEGTLYIIDGVQVRGGAGRNLPQNLVDQVQVMTSGIPAKYGDALGGVINITTKGVTDQTQGNVLLERSVDRFNHNLANFSLLGPLFSKKVNGVKKPLVGFMIGIDGIYDEDRRPTYGGNYVIKEDVLKAIEANPLRPVTTTTGATAFRYATEYLRKEDFEISKVRQNAEVLEGRVNGKLDFQLAENLNLTAGGSFNYTKSRGYSGNTGYYPWTLYASDAIPTDISIVPRGYLRLTQRFGKTPTSADEKKPLISNAYYTLQVDYAKDYFSRENKAHQDDVFKYGYVGKFYTDYTKQYRVGVEDSSGLSAVILDGDHRATSTRFERSELNPILANYTSQWYNYMLNDPQDITTLRAQRGLANGDQPPYIYGGGDKSGWANVGYSQGGFQRQENDQFAATVDASFDLQAGKTRHQIGFGLYYQQRVERFYSAAGASFTGNNLWQYMRLLANSHIALDKTNPIFLVNGQRYSLADYRDGRISVSPFDTVLYDRSANLAVQSTFDRNLRDKLNLDKNGTDYVDVDNYDPSTFSLGMFSADELLNNGDNFVNYYGYDYTGKKLNGQVNFNDFFTQKDANGNYTRNMGAYRPNYIGGYIMDKFEFKDLLFNIGVRVDRFDANTKVLKDPYSLYQVKTLGDARSSVKNDLNGSHPTNIGDDYVVYVNSNESATPSVVGYRNGDDWYDPFGNRVEDPTVLKQYSGGRDAQPFLADSKVRITDSTFNPNSSFTDYTPQVNVMPRISFSFPISDVAKFYAHYDVIVQRPTNGTVFATPADYLFLNNNDNVIMQNPNLKPQKMFDYEVGFQQQITQRSALTISGFYKERKDMIAVRPYMNAWPKTYYTFGNRDFSTTKGMILKYDLRRIGNLRMDVNYTLQFADGSGSGTASGNGGSNTFVSNNGMLANFIQAGLPNLRYASALDIDSRHSIVANVDYRFSDNDGPVIGNTHFLQNAGVNFIFRTRSGEPYTKMQFPAPGHTVSGQLNGSRYPWHYNLDLRVDKDFKLAFGKKKAQEGASTKEPLILNAYVMIMNVLNTRDVLSINGYTGRPDDDGFLTSPQGIQVSNNQADKQSYIDQYSILLMDPNNINLPRRVNVGLQLNF